MKEERSKIYRWLDERLGISGLLEFGRKKKVPDYRGTIWYYTGGMTMFLFFIQILTGILLLVYYQPGEDTSYESVKYIMNSVDFGWLVRSIHSWSANLMILFVFIHMFVKFFFKVYRKPREFIWITGFILLLLSLTFGFSGYLLPYNTLSYFATRIGTDSITAIPFIGKTLLVILRGGEDVSNATILRFFALHIIVLPILTFIVLGIHLALIMKFGSGESISFLKYPPEKKKYFSFIPDFVMRDFIGWLVMFEIIVLLSVLFPAELGKKADPFEPAPPGIKPEWYFLFAYETLKIFPSKVFFIEGEILAMIIILIGAIFWLMVPFLDKWSNREEKSPVFTIIGVIVLTYLVVFTLIGLLKKKKKMKMNRINLRSLIINFAGILFVLIIIFVNGISSQEAEEKDRCFKCHTELDGELKLVADQHRESVHRRAGITCAGCHGGDPSTDDMEKAMSQKAGFIGVPEFYRIPYICAKCHSNPDYMRQYNPALPTDQLQKYWTSKHGILLKKNKDEKVAQCISCHSTHNIISGKNPRSPVYPLNIPKTCNKCHNAKYMEGRNIKTGEYDDYIKSVHGIALLKNRDLGAPACNTCHGNHGAQPPEVDNIAKVCHMCHVIEADYFVRSVHNEVFKEAGLLQCAVCHNYHNISKPDDSFVGVGEKSVCITCHSEGDGGFEIAKNISLHLDSLNNQYNKAIKELEIWKNRGFDMDDDEFSLRDVNQILKNIRRLTHLVNVDSIYVQSKNGFNLLNEIYGSFYRVSKEYKSRWYFFVIITIVILVLAILIFTKIRALKKSE